jgi:phosphatidylglycerol:prolipoprotein diacylglycerol transferase
MIPYLDFDKYFRAAHLPIHMFGILVACGILVGSRLTQKRARDFGCKDEQTSQMITYTLVTGFILAHLFDVFAYQSAEKTPTMLDIINPFGGLSSYGGFAGALIGMFYWCKKFKQRVMPYADGLAFGLAPGWFFGRMGCFTAHDHPGRFSSAFIAVRYPEGARFDLGLLEALWALGLTCIFLLLARKKRPLGLYVTLICLFYAPCRFVLDFLRATDVRGADPRYGGLTPGQYGSILVLLAGLGLLRWYRAQERK